MEKRCAYGSLVLGDKSSGVCACHQLSLTHADEYSWTYLCQLCDGCVCVCGLLLEDANTSQLINTVQELVSSQNVTSSNLSCVCVCVCVSSTDSNVKDEEGRFHLSRKLHNSQHQAENIHTDPCSI